MSRAKDDVGRIDARDTGAVAGRDVNISGGLLAAGRDLIIENLFAADVPARPAARDGPNPRDRRDLILRVRTGWVDRMPSAGIELELRARPDLVTSSWRDTAQEVPPPPSFQRTDSVTAVFDELFSGPDSTFDGILLITGGAGSGKTTLLTQLARDLLARAERDDAQPVPVVFALSAWAPTDGSLGDWMAGQLSRRYRLLTGKARGWVEGSHVLPLLDGLDEVTPRHRDACVAAIDKLRANHPSPIVVTARESDGLLGTGSALGLAGAIAIEPLRPAQVDRHLQQAGSRLAGVRAALRDDPELRALASTPLLLTVMRIAYEGKSAREVRTSGGPEERRMHIFHAYAHAVFERRAESSRFTREQTLHWLAWIARCLRAGHETAFDPAWMQPKWLPDLAGWLAVVAGPAVVGGLAAGLLAGLPWLVAAGAAGAAWAVALVGTVAGLVIWSEQIRPVERTRWSWSALAAWMRRSLGFGLRLYGVLAVGIGGLLALWVRAYTPDQTSGRMLADILAAGLALAVLSGLTVGLVGGFFAARVEVARVPGDDESGLPRAWVKRTLVTTAPFAVLFMLLGAVLGAPRGVAVACAYAVSAGLVAALVMARKAGALAEVQHIALLRVAHARGLGPRRHEDLVAFLDHAADRILLVKRGSSYGFLHGLLAEYFAALEPQPAVRWARYPLIGWTERPIPWPVRDSGPLSIPTPVRQVATMKIPSGFLVVADFDAVATRADIGLVPDPARILPQELLAIDPSGRAATVTEIGAAEFRVLRKRALVVAVPAGTFPVFVSRWHHGHVHAEWTALEVRLQAGVEVPVTRTLGAVALGPGDLLVADADALKDWQGTGRDNLADVEIWSYGTAAEAAAKRFGIPRRSSRTWACRDLPLPDARRRARSLRWWARLRGRSLQVVVREHLGWHDLLAAARACEEKLAFCEVAGGTVLALETPVGGRELAVEVDVSQGEEVVQIRVVLG